MEDANDSPPLVAHEAASQIPVDLFVSKKHPGVPQGNLGFADSSGNVLFRVARLPSPKARNSRHSKRLILDSSGSPLISLHRLDKGSWEGFEGGEDAEKEMLFRVRRTVNKLCRTEFEVFLSSQDQSKPDFKTSLMYKLHEVHASRSKFRLTVFPGSIDHALVVALVVIFLS
ncbi:Protein LURP-one-related 7 [Linum grandiflorum]